MKQEKQWVVFTHAKKSLVGYVIRKGARTAEIRCQAGRIYTVLKGDYRGVKEPQQTVKPSGGSSVLMTTGEPWSAVRTAYCGGERVSQKDVMKAFARASGTVHGVAPEMETDWNTAMPGDTPSIRAEEPKEVTPSAPVRCAMSRVMRSAFDPKYRRLLILNRLTAKHKAFARA